MLVSDSIAKLIEQMLDDGDGETELKRNDMAVRLGCVPSQISYVISSRFTPERGYIIESRRGGGGYIRIIRAKMDKNEYLMHFFHAIGNSLDAMECKAYICALRDNDIITTREEKIISSILIGGALECAPSGERNTLRADIMRHAVMALLG